MSPGIHRPGYHPVFPGVKPLNQARSGKIAGWAQIYLESREL